MLVLVAAASVGSHLIDAAGRAPAAIEAALRIQTHATAVLSIIANMESDRRGYELTGMREHLAALHHDHEQVHEALQQLRDAVASWPVLQSQVDSAEGEVGYWSDEFTSAPAAPQAAGAHLARDRQLLGAARRHLGSVVEAGEREARAAQLDVRLARARARRLWLAVTVLTLLAIVTLAELAQRRQRRLQLAHREIALVLEAMPFALASLDRGGAIRHASGEAKALFGTATRNLVGRRFVELVAALDRAEVESGLSRAIAGEHVVCEAQVQTEFETRVLALAFAPIVEHDATVGVSVVSRDATVERAFRTQVRHSDRLARVGTVAAGIVHELKGPLTSIPGLAASVDPTRLNQEDRAALRTIVSETRRAARMVRTIVDFSRRQAHRHEPTDIANVLTQTVNLCRYDPRTREVEFGLDVPPGLPAVMADEQELLEVFLNLLVNAEHAVRNQPVRRVEVRAQVAGRRVLVSVEDTGPGIPDDQLETVFQPFYTTKARGEATGLGLAIARGVVTEHQGSIWAERAAGGGARLVVALPTIGAAETSDPRRASGARPLAAREVDNV